MAEKPKEDHAVILPHFNGVVRHFSEAFTHLVREQARSEGILSQVPAYIIHEGDSSTIVRGAEAPEQTEMHEATAEIELKKADIERFTISDAISAINRLAEQFRRQQSQMLFTTLDEVTEKTGNVVSGKGKPLTHEAMFEVLTKIEHDFSSGPGPNLVMVASPDLEPQLAELQEEFANSPELQKKFQALMAEKYEQYRDREMDRNLAG